MALFLQKDYQGVGVLGNVDEGQAQLDLAMIADKDTGLGWTSTMSPNRTRVTYTGATNHAPQIRLSELVNLPLTENIIIVAAGSSFVLSGLNVPITAVGAVVWPPYSFGNNSADYFVIYDISQNNGLGYCGARKKPAPQRRTLESEMNITCTISSITPTAFGKARRSRARRASAIRRRMPTRLRSTPKTTCGSKSATTCSRRRCCVTTTTPVW